MRRGLAALQDVDPAAGQVEATVGLSGWDWGFVLWFLAVTTGVGLYYARRASKSLDEYFLSGRDLPWWALGTSMVATTFAADTPIVVAGFVVAGGIAKNWLWWSFLFGGTLTVFLFSRLWRRASVFTEIELIDRRYDGGAAKALRGFKAVFLGLVVNSIIFGFVTKAMSSVVAAVLPIDEVVALGILLVLALIYTMLSGLWGVVATDVLQFVMALLGAVLLAVLALDAGGGLDAVVERVRVLGDQQGRDLLAIFPTDWGSALGASVMILVLVNWWAVYYPGAEPGGGGYVAQRMLAAKDERHARAGTLWFVFAHYALRPWPWILVALAAVALEPRFLETQVLLDSLAQSGAEDEAVDAAVAQAGLADYGAEAAYPWTFRFLPVGLLGLVVASFFAAFMSTITTTLNLSASYLVNDLYLPFFARQGETERHRVMVSRITVAVVSVVGALVSWVLATAGDGWTAIMHLTAGTGLVLILRWLWWRISAWSEIAAMVGSAIGFFANQSFEIGAKLAEATGGPADELGLLFTVACSTVAWLAVTFVTPPTGESKLQAFFRQVRPGGAWGPVARATGVAPSPLSRDLVMWLFATVMVFGTLLGFGSWLLGDTRTGYGLLGTALGSGVILFALLRREPRTVPAESAE